jgi:[ribosomal protein S18]-alanine N-acetyltransferase
MTASHPLLVLPTLTLRRLKLADITAMMAIESTSFGQFHWSAQAFEQEMANHLARYWVLLQQTPAGADSLLGYFGYWLVFDEVHITTLAIAEAHRGQKLGELLVAKAVEQTQTHSARVVTLEVRKHNHVAQHLYSRYGFDIMGIRPGYYQDNHEDALIMTNPDVLDPDFRPRFASLKQQLFTRLTGIPTGFYTNSIQQGR